MYVQEVSKIYTFNCEQFEGVVNLQYCFLHPPTHNCQNSSSMYLSKIDLVCNYRNCMHL